ncbi:hypothetical protein B0H10DRAFT_406994 [Mycena sp. CBHHK59/15]|nr:hypothetical protein B0H10DRAFT_406994 [Mycena sp. CBHHK59/15]
MKLTDQTPEIHAVLSGAIKIIRILCILVEAYPILKSRTGYAKTHMLTFARGKAELIHVVIRLEADPRMSRWLGNIATDRLSTVRSDAKQYAGVIVPGLYRFAHLDAASIKVLVEDLLDNDNYIYAVSLITGKPDDTQPFRHPAITKMLKDQWFTGNFATQNAEYFKASREKYPDQFEAPDPPLAMAANAILAVLTEYQLTGKRQNIKFTEAAYEDSYRHHPAHLAEMHNDAPTTTARLLHEVYEDCHERQNHRCQHQIPCPAYRGP